MGSRIIEGAERAMMLRDAEVDPSAWRKHYAKAETVALEDVDGKPAYKVVLTPHEGKPVTHWFDRSSGLLVKSEMVAQTHMGDIQVVSWHEDWREADGIMMPRRLRQEMMGMEQRFTFDTVETNVELPADRFTPPAEILELAAKKKEAVAVE
jgi:hypothetical protein